MSVAAKPRAVLVSTGNRGRESEESKKKTEVLKKPKPKPKKPEMSPAVVRQNLSVDSSCSSDSSNSSSSTSTGSLNRRRTVKRDKLGSGEFELKKNIPIKRCDWITSNSDPLYISFHDEEWGVPVHDDGKLFELLVFSQALAEMSWPTILPLRHIFRKYFENFYPASVAQFTEKKLLSMKVNGNLLLSEPKLRAVVENAKLLSKVQQEFGSFSNYCWRFVNNKPLRNGFRYRRQIPVKTPKAELISKDLMQRGFRYVGPTVVYSFMQVSGIVNDHLATCFRFEGCNANIKKKCDSNVEQAEITINKALNNTCFNDQVL